MKINRKGLWFKLHKAMGTDEYYELLDGYKVSLCPYFWKGLGCLLVCLLGVVCSVFALFALVCILTFLTGPYTGWWGFGNMATGGAVIVIGGLTITTFTSPFWGLPVFPNWIKKPVAKVFKKTIPETPKSVNVIKEYYKAHKSKFCPMIELEDDK